MVIDMHTHIMESEAVLPKKWLESVYEYRRQWYGEEAFEKAKPTFDSRGRVEMLIRGMDELRTSDAGQQTIDALNKIKHNLEEAGTSPENIVRLNVYVKYTERDGDSTKSASIEYLKKKAPDLLENPPASTWIGVNSLYHQTCLWSLKQWL